MKIKQLLSIKDTLRFILDRHGEKIDMETKVDIDSTLNFINNVIIDAEKERKRRRLAHVTYQLRVDFSD